MLNKVSLLVQMLQESKVREAGAQTALSSLGSGFGDFFFLSGKPTEYGEQQ